MDFIKTKKYNKEFLAQNMMGPNSIMILEELMQNIPLKKGMRVLDMGCGRGLTSLFLAKEYGVQVFALDLWISATENYERFKEMEADDLIIPIHADVNDMPFADGYFDAVISVDSYHYYGNNDTFFSQKVMPLIKDGAVFAVAFPGMKCEVHEHVPKDMAELWDEEALPMWQTADWWRPKFEPYLSNFNIWQMECFDSAWNDWLSTDNPYAISDRDMIKTDNGRYMNLIGITGTLKKGK